MCALGYIVLPRGGCKNCLRCLYANARGLLDIHNPSEALRNLDDDEISNLSNAEVRNIDVPNRGMNIISESGLYSLIFRSRKPEAHRFRRWVTSESLPSICRTGSYTARPSESTEKRG